MRDDGMLRERDLATFGADGRLDRHWASCETNRLKRNAHIMSAPQSLAARRRDGFLARLRNAGVEPGDSEQLAGAMCKLLADPQLAARLGAAGERSVAEAWATAAATVSEALARAGGGDVAIGS